MIAAAVDMVRSDYDEDMDGPDVSAPEVTESPIHLMDEVTVCHWNAQSFDSSKAGHMGVLSSLLHIDVWALGETQVDVLPTNILPSFDWYHEPLAGKGGGVALGWRRNLFAAKILPRPVLYFLLPGALPYFRC